MTKKTVKKEAKPAAKKPEGEQHIDAVQKDFDATVKAQAKSDKGA